MDILRHSCRKPTKDGEISYDTVNSDGLNSVHHTALQRIENPNLEKSVKRFLGFPTVWANGEPQAMLEYPSTFMHHTVTDTIENRDTEQDQRRERCGCYGDWCRATGEEKIKPA